MMEWYHVLSIVLGAIGGIGGISGGISIYHAKSNKQSIDIDNLREIIEEERTERQNLRNEYEGYKKSVDERIIMFKKEFAEMKETNMNYLKAIQRAYRCKLPAKIEDCPVIKEFNESGCLHKCEAEKNE